MLNGFPDCTGGNEMSWSASQVAICFIGLLHLVFMIGELYPWEHPRIMMAVLEKWPHHLELSGNDTDLVAMVVHNAGIYNGIVAAGLFASAYVGAAAFPVQVALLAGGVIAGLFGAKTLSRLVIGQAVLSAIALGVVVFFR
jgi:uncharacterized membrane protein